MLLHNFLLGVLITSSNICNGFEAISWAKLAFEILDGVMDIYKESHDIPLPISSKEKKLYDGIANMATLLRQVERNLATMTLARMKELERDFSEIIHFEFQIDELVKSINFIENCYEEFFALRDKFNRKLNSTENGTHPIHHSLVEFAKSVTAYTADSVRHSMTKIHDTALPRDNPLSSRNIFTLVLNHFNNKAQSRCLIDGSPQQLVYSIYTSLKVVQIKGLALFEFSYMILHLHTGEDYNDTLIEYRNRILDKMKKQGEVVSVVMNSADNEFWKCDPPQHIPDETYTEITHFLQGYVHNERELSNKGDCIEGCSHYEYVNNPSCSNKDPLCSKQVACKGRVLNCKMVDHDMNICFANPLSSRRYQWIHYQNGFRFGNSSNYCRYSQNEVKMYRNYLFWRCFYCFCLCDEDSPFSDRFFSLQEATSDIENNKIIVGVRFIKKNRVIYLQIKEGKLLAEGSVESSNVSWIPVPYINVNSFADYGKYHKLRYEMRALDLDDILAPEKFLVTGVRFRTIGAHLNMEVRLTGFDFESGILYPNLTYWKGNDNTDAVHESPRQQFFASTQLPGVGSCMPDSDSDTFIQFTHSDEFEDAAQTTVPFIDIQPVEPKPAIPLIGVGILHKGHLKSSGFIEPKVFTYNIGKHLLKVDDFSRKI